MRYKTWSIIGAGVAFIFTAMTALGTENGTLTLVNQNMQDITVTCPGGATGTISQGTPLVLPFQSIVSRLGINQTCVFMVNDVSIGDAVIQVGTPGFYYGVIQSVQPVSGYSEAVTVNGQPATPPTDMSYDLGITFSQ